MDMNRIGGNNYREQMKELRYWQAVFHGNECKETEAEKRVEFEADKYRCKEAERIEIEPQNRPVVKRGKGKVKKW